MRLLTQPLGWVSLWLILWLVFVWSLLPLIVRLGLVLDVSEATLLLMLLGVPLILAEVVALSIHSRAGRRRASTEFVTHSLKRILASPKRGALAIRLYDALSDVRWSIKHRMGTAELDTFLLKPIREIEVLPVSEVPDTSTELLEGIAFEYVDRAQRDRPPWPTIVPLVQRLGHTLATETPTDSARAALIDEYSREVSAWYRQRACLPPPPGRGRRFFDEHERELKWLVEVVGPVVILASSLLLLG